MRDSGKLKYLTFISVVGHATTYGRYLFAETLADWLSTTVQ